VSRSGVGSNGYDVSNWVYCWLVHFFPLAFRSLFNIFIQVNVYIAVILQKQHPSNRKGLAGTISTDEVEAAPDPVD
jgi:hypothetical protein